MKIKLILADDHPTLIAGIQYELASVNSIVVVGTASNSTEVVALLSSVQCDILMTDYAMPGGEYGDGIAFLSFLRRRFPDLKIIVFTSINNPAIATEIARLGVQSVLSKVDDVAHLVSAVRTVYAGETYFSPGMQQARDVFEQARAVSTAKQLTKREAEVVRLYLSGLSINVIAAQLRRTKQTVSSQKTSAMRKLGIKHDIDLFRFASEVGLIVGADSPKTE
ncbi:LuxR family transcriptional regulator [Burkholderia ubonensis]|uniref:response regulator transcription factor n=1 Tax=Burkholderia ubonensis TaxID=101571 RepID=UPI0007576264|nr:response regulator transcription factor [Burkholderia ubonensis]KVD66253.1 LuxR family transcriptional regulator [Burkholderia ubonensis]